MRKLSHIDIEYLTQGHGSENLAPSSFFFFFFWLPVLNLCLLMTLSDLWFSMSECLRIAQLTRDFSMPQEHRVVLIVESVKNV